MDSTKGRLHDFGVGWRFEVGELVRVADGSAAARDGGRPQAGLGLVCEKGRYRFRRGRQRIDAASEAPIAEDREVGPIGFARGGRFLGLGEFSGAVEIGGRQRAHQLGVWR